MLKARLVSHQAASVPVPEEGKEANPPVSPDRKEVGPKRINLPFLLLFLAMAGGGGAGAAVLLRAVTG